MPSTDVRERAHELIDRIAITQVSAVVGLLETMLDPFAQTLANAPFDDEPVTDEDRLEIAESRSAVPGKVFSNEEVLADFGLTVADFDRMGETPLESTEATR